MDGAAEACLHRVLAQNIAAQASSEVADHTLTRALVAQFTQQCRASIVEVESALALATQTRVEGVTRELVSYGSPSGGAVAAGSGLGRGGMIASSHSSGSNSSGFKRRMSISWTDDGVDDALGSLDGAGSGSQLLRSLEAQVEAAVSARMFVAGSNSHPGLLAQRRASIVGRVVEEVREVVKTHSPAAGIAVQRMVLHLLDAASRVRCCQLSLTQLPHRRRWPVHAPVPAPMNRSAAPCPAHSRVPVLCCDRPTTQVWPQLRRACYPLAPRLMGPSPSGRLRALCPMCPRWGLRWPRPAEAWLPWASVWRAPWPRPFPGAPWAQAAPW